MRTVMGTWPLRDAESRAMHGQCMANSLPMQCHHLLCLVCINKHVQSNTGAAVCAHGPRAQLAAHAVSAYLHGAEWGCAVRHAG